MSDSDPAYALNQPYSPTSGFNALQYAMEMKKLGIMTCTIAKVVKLRTKGNGARDVVGRIDIQPLVQMVDGIQKTVDHVSVYNLPYVRMFGGTNAVIIDPQVGDLGLVISADRDISGVKQKLDKAPPGSGRKFSIADGIFISGCLSKDKPENYVRFVDHQTLELSPDSGTTSIWLTPGRIDLGMKNAPHAVVTVDGPSTKVFAVISESGSQD